MALFRPICLPRELCQITNGFVSVEHKITQYWNRKRKKKSVIYAYKIRSTYNPGGPIVGWYILQSFVAQKTRFGWWIIWNWLQLTQLTWRYEQPCYQGGGRRRRGGVNETQNKWSGRSASHVIRMIYILIPCIQNRTKYISMNTHSLCGSFFRENVQNNRSRVYGRHRKSNLPRWRCHQLLYIWIKASH